jgi:PII-like signaling protein
VLAKTFDFGAVFSPGERNVVEVVHEDGTEGATSHRGAIGNDP